MFVDGSFDLVHKAITFPTYKWSQKKVPVNEPPPMVFLPAITRQEEDLAMWAAVQEMIGLETKSIVNGIFKNNNLKQVPDSSISFIEKSSIRLRRALNRNPHNVINQDSAKIYRTCRFVVKHTRTKLRDAIVYLPPFEKKDDKKQGSTSRPQMFNELDNPEFTKGYTQFIKDQDLISMNSFSADCAVLLSKAPALETASRYVTHVLDTRSLAGLSKKDSVTWSSCGYKYVNVPKPMVVNTPKILLILGISFLVLSFIKAFWETMTWPFQLVSSTLVRFFNFLSFFWSFLVRALQWIKRKLQNQRASVSSDRQDTLNEIKNVKSVDGGDSFATKEPKLSIDSGKEPSIDSVIDIQISKPANDLLSANKGSKDSSTGQSKSPSPKVSLDSDIRSEKIRQNFENFKKKNDPTS